MQSDIDNSKRLPAALFLIGILMCAGTLVLTARLIWEMTWLTWQQGPQMVGFSLAHSIYGIAFLFPFMLCIWVLIVALLMGVWKIRHKNIAKQTWQMISCALAVLGLLSIPQGFWNTVFVGRLAHGPHAATQLVYSAGCGEKRIVDGLLKRGVPVNATNHEGSTALHYAAGAGETQIVADLIDSGANVNAINLWGNSPLHNALANHQTATAQLLTVHGAKDIQGDEQQRDRAAHEIVRRDIERMNNHP